MSVKPSFLRRTGRQVARPFVAYARWWGKHARRAMASEAHREVQASIAESWGILRRRWASHRKAAEVADHADSASKRGSPETEFHRLLVGWQISESELPTVICNLRKDIWIQLGMGLLTLVLMLWWGPVAALSDASGFTVTRIAITAGLSALVLVNLVHALTASWRLACLQDRYYYLINSVVHLCLFVWWYWVKGGRAGRDRDA